MPRPANDQGASSLLQQRTRISRGPLTASYGCGGIQPYFSTPPEDTFPGHFHGYPGVLVRSRLAAYFLIIPRDAVGTAFPDREYFPLISDDFYDMQVT